MMRRRGYGRGTGNKVKKGWVVLLIAFVALAGVLSFLLWGKARRGAQPEEVSQEVAVEDTLYRFGLPIEYFTVHHDVLTARAARAVRRNLDVLISDNDRVVVLKFGHYLYR